MNENSQQTESIRDLICSIDKDSVSLPEFQRDFVWNLKQTYDLFDSLVRNIFIGSIIYGKPSFEISVRELDKRPRKGEGSRKKLKIESFDKEQLKTKSNINNFRIILDGQQRVTSLYRALKGIDEVYFIAKNQEDLDNGDYSKLTLEDILYEFDGQENENRMSVKISDVYKILNYEIISDSEKEEIFKSTAFYRESQSEYEENSCLYSSHFKKYLIVLAKLQELLTKEKLLSFYLFDMDSEKFALFFERSNSKGIQLNFIDILSAKLYKGFNLRGKIEQFEEDNPDFKPLNREIIVRTISYIVSGGKDVDRSYILADLNHQHFNDLWYEVCELYKKTLMFLYKNNFIITQNWMPYEYMLIPLMIFSKEINGDFSQMQEKQFEFIKYWYWSSIFSARYTGATNDNIVHDSNTLKLIAQNKKISNKTLFNKLKPITTSTEDLYSYSQKRGAIYKGVLNLINYSSQGLKDWNNSSKINFNSSIDDHHIFPKAFIQAEYKDDEKALSLVDCVVNKTLIPKITNIKIGKKSPSTYINDIRQNNSEILTCLESHLITPNITEEELDFFFVEEFIEKRAEKIFNLIQDNTILKRGNIISEFYDTDKFKKTGNIEVFGTYYNKTVKATFNIEKETIIYNGTPLSVSLSADQAKRELTGNDNTSTNGWTFWQWKDEDGQVFKIDEFRKNKELNPV